MRLAPTTLKRKKKLPPDNGGFGLLSGLLLVLALIASAAFLLWLPSYLRPQVDQVFDDPKPAINRVAKYTGSSVPDASIHSVHVVPIERRRARRSVAAIPKGVHGIARECGSACRLSLRAGTASDDGPPKKYRVHLHRAWRKSTGRDVHVVPVVQYVESDTEQSARGGRVPLECMYEARVDGVAEHSLLNLCDDEHGILGLLALPDGIFTVEPIKAENATGKIREHTLQKSSVHLHPSRLVFDYVGESDAERGKPVQDYLNLTEHPWEDLLQRKERSRRAANSWDYHVEVLVVADTEMYRYHGPNLESYLLTLFSTVASIYRHHSLKAAINIAVVKIVILKNEHSGPSVTPNAQETLRSFCRWQTLYNGRPGEARAHHDVAILLTRGDICRSAGKCDTLGLAELGTMCDREKSCAIIEDNGLSAAFTIAHELGHTFNVPHDDEQKCAQHMELKKGNYHIMAPTLEYNTHPWSWSPCSSALLERFLDGNRGQVTCLMDRPTERRYYDALYEDQQPGQKYTVDQQCKFVFGASATVCPYMPACRRLWCSINVGNSQGCRTQHMPWADGTPCQARLIFDAETGGARNQYCFRGDCVSMHVGNSLKVDGGWGAWGGYGPCSRTCGGGVQKSIRECDQPRPANGGKYCIGKRETYRSCATSDCPWDTPPFRDVQCAKHNFKSRQAGLHGLHPKTTWTPKYGVPHNERCKLTCRVDGTAAFHTLEEKVIDGTPCDQHGDDICIDGTCTSAGCDHVLHSGTKRDECGVCGGDGTTCEVISGTYNEARLNFGYNQVMKIPAGAANIDITQTAATNSRDVEGKIDDNNYLALRLSDGTFLLNGNYQVSMFRIQIPLQDTIIEYSGSDNYVERINATGPLRTDIFLNLLTVENMDPANIRYSYRITRPGRGGSGNGGGAPGTVHRPNNAYYRWHTDDTRWTECSAPCQGRQSAEIACLDANDKRVDDRYCPARRPSATTRMCNIECTLRWMSEQVSQCSAQCGHGSVRLRVYCAKVDSSGRSTPLPVSGSPSSSSSPCPGTPPADTRPCYIDCNGRRWTYSEWSECTETCGDKGVKRRKATCMDNTNRILDDGHCVREAREETERECGRTPCPRWSYSAWAECSRSCDGGYRMRHASCVDAADREIPRHLCNANEMLVQERCNEHICTQWEFSTWSECSATCGTGVHSRSAKCTNSAGHILDSSRCNAQERIVQKPCMRPACPHWKMTEWSDCSVTCLDGWRSRRVTCVDAKNVVISEEQCSHEKRPDEHETCTNGPCPFWRLGEWTACSASCGEGVRKRIVECLHKDLTVDASYCNVERSPASEEKCVVLSCAAWNASDWTPCSVTCGSGSQERRLTCTRDGKKVEDRECAKLDRPRTSKHCDRDCTTPLMTNRPGPLAPTPSIFWATAPWTECSATCGEGTQRRQVMCRENGEDVAASRCSHLEVVESVQSCTLRPCGTWLVDDWKPCPVTCGSSAEQTRPVRCVSTVNSSVVLDDTTCDVKERPDASRACSLPACPAGREPPPGQWKTQPWSKCSATCGGGWRSREVVCERAQCIGVKPMIFDRCNNAPCPKDENAWQITPWTSCSVTCGGGEERRKVWCEHVASRKKVDENECKPSKPVEQRGCFMPSCAPPPLPSSSSSTEEGNGLSSFGPTRLDWSAGPWGACSAKCGRGEKRRVVSCIDADSGLSVNSTLCDAFTMPNSTMVCRSRCARWKTQPWGECSTTCGTGSRTRVVLCQMARGKAAPLSECSHLPKPAEIGRCYGAPCPAYRWMATPWSTCVNPCSRDAQIRRVYCMSSQSRRAAPRMCADRRPPPTSRPCSVERCPYVWEPAPWNTCSVSCGNGTQTRALDCRIQEGMAVDASLSASSVPRDKCAKLDAPPTQQPCAQAPCNAEFHWEAGQWQQCSATCGKGIRRRRVKCIHTETGRRASREECALLASRPPRSQPCFQKNCLPASCEEIRQQSSNDARKDGNYSLLLDGYPLIVYCARMNETIPRAYLNVDPKTNFAEVYGKKLIFPDTCPHDGRRNDSCACSDDGDANAGRTHFSKIRVDLNNKKININDFSFASTKSGVPVPYATAGDCYSKMECPQGKFSVDLRGSGVKIVDDLMWRDIGMRSRSEIDRFHENTLIVGACGGYCGKCAPDMYKGLVFEVNRNKPRSLSPSDL